MACSHKCGGACCQRFLLGNNISPEQLKAEYLAWSTQHRDGTTLTLAKSAKHDSSSLSSSHQNVHADIHLIYPMLIHLGEFNWNPCDPKTKIERKLHHWSCKHFDKKTKLCQIYDIRPNCCVNYPGNGPCLFPGCEIPGNKKRLKALHDKRKLSANKYEVGEDKCVKVERP